MEEAACLLAMLAVCGPKSLPMELGKKTLGTKRLTDGEAGD